MSRSGLPYALGAVGVLAVAGALAPRRQSPLRRFPAHGAQEQIAAVTV